MKGLTQQLRTDLQDEESRYVYADTITNAFIAAQIKTLQKERGLTQTKLAELMGTKQSGISRLQKTDYGAYKVETLRRFARAFGVRLRIRFEEFGTLLDEMTGFTDRSLAPKSFEQDPILSSGSKPKRRVKNPGRTKRAMRKPVAHEELGRLHAATQIPQFMISRDSTGNNNSGVCFMPTSGGNQSTGAPAGNQWEGLVANGR